MTTPTTSPVPIMCKCGSQLGEEISIQGLTLLHTGDVISYEQHGWCLHCGAQFHWSAKGSQMNLVIRGIKIFKKGLPIHAG